MKLLTIFLAICVAHQHAFAASEFELNVKVSVDRILRQIDVVIADPPLWNKLPDLIGMLLECLSQTQVLEVVGNQLPSNIKEYLESLVPAEVAKQVASRLKSNGAFPQPRNQSAALPDDLKEELKLFMATPNFETLHNYIWSNVEYLDLIGYFHGAGYPEIYTLIQAFYVDMGQPDLAETIPDAPPAPPSRSHRAKRSLGTGPHKSHGMSSFPIQLKSPIILACDIAKIIATLSEFKFHNVIQLVIFTLEEIIGKPSTHVLFMKLGEYQKGEFFHGLLELPEMQEAFPLMHRILLSKVSITELDKILQVFTGLTLENLDLFKYFINLFNYLVWSYPFPN